jgi:hypothetical protein
MRGMHSLRRILFPRDEANQTERLIEDLPAYRVAFWPDGWVLDEQGGVLLRDTHETAEARRWYALAGNGRMRENACRVMSLHGIYVPRSIVDLAGRRFVSESVASVAVRLVAGEWVEARRRALVEKAEQTLRHARLAWSGSRYGRDLDGEEIDRLLQRALALCVAEGLIPDARYRFSHQRGNGYGIPVHRCTVEIPMEGDERARVAEAVGAALIPWNRAVIRDGACVPLIAVDVNRPAADERWTPAGP